MAHHHEVADLMAENERLRSALQVFVGCAYPVAASINPRGHSWMSEKALDFALGEAKAALRPEGKP